MTEPIRRPFERAPPPLARRAAPYATIMAGSLVTILPMLPAGPILPPFGLLMLLAWRLLRPDSLRVWASAPLGLFDDLVSGQPFGSAMAIWTLVTLVIEVVDIRLTAHRSFRQDWLLAAGATVGALWAGRLIAVPWGAAVDTMLSLQIMASILVFPAVARIVALIERRRTPA